MVDTRPLSDFLPYKDLFHDGTMRLSGNGLMAMIEYRGVDYELTPNNLLLYLSNRIAAYIANFGTQSGWTVNTDTLLIESAPYLSGPAFLGGESFPSNAAGAPRYLDDVRARRFAGQLTDERSFISISMRPPKAKAAWLEKLIKKGGPEKVHHWSAYIDDFQKVIDALLTGLKGEFGSGGFARPMNANAVLRFLGFAATGQDHESLRFPSGVRSWPMDHFLKTFDVLMGRQIRLDGRPTRHVRSIGIAGSPSHHTPEMMAGLMTVGHPLRISQRYRLMFAETVHDHYRKGMQTKKDEEFSLIGHLANLMPSTRGIAAPDAINMAKTMMSTAEATQTARIECGGTLTTNIMVYADSWSEADARAEAVRAFIQNKIGFKPQVENANARAAYFASFPGEIDRNKRGDILDNDFIARRMRITAPWQGAMRSRSPWGGPALLQAVTEGNAKFLFDPFGEKWGHMVGFGPNGSGKSTDAAYLTFAWHARHPRGKVIRIEADSALSTGVVATLANGGRIVSMSAGGLSLQPLRHLDDPDVLKSKHGWIQGICTAQHVPPTPDLNDDIGATLKLLAGETPDRRTMKQMYRLAGTPELRKALNLYANDGPYAALLNGRRNPFEGTNDLLLELGKFAADNRSPLDEPIIEAVMYEVEQAIDDETPTLMILDEGKMTVRAMGEQRAVDYAARMRKKRCILFFLFHFLDQDFVNLVAALREQCAWRLFFPNADATDPAARGWMSQLGVTETMARKIASAPKGCVAGVTEGRARMFDLALGPEDLALCGINGRLRNDAAQRLFDEVGPERFWIDHLKMEGIDIDEEKYLSAVSRDRALALAG